LKNADKSQENEINLFISEIEKVIENLKNKNNILIIECDELKQENNNLMLIKNKVEEDEINVKTK
jgi:hypothetical protein